jgi:hypothetical protein
MTKENIPRVIIFRGRVNIFKIGFRRTNNNVNAKPPIRYDIKPPETFIPETA